MSGTQEKTILESCRRVSERADQVETDAAAIRTVASWMAYEELSWPVYWSDLTPEAEDQEVADFLFLSASMNFAFTDFQTGKIFQVEHDGRTLSDADAMLQCWKRAYQEGTPILEGEYLARMSEAELARVLHGKIPVPLLARRVEILREIGEQLCENSEGRFHRWLARAPRRLYSGRGFLAQFVEAFSSFQDEGSYQGGRVVFWKRAQLLSWQLQVCFRQTGFFSLEDPEKLTFLADYIVPMALHLHGILHYSSELRRKISGGELLVAGEEWEIEIRAATVWAGHLLTKEINRLRPPDRQIIDTVVDARLWTHFHNTHHPHHLTETTAY